MSHRFTSLLTHLIFSTKDRLPYLDPELAPECRAYIGGIIENVGGRRIEIGSATDHVHIFFDMPAALSLSDCVRTIKCNSSKWIHEKWPWRSRFAWQRGFSGFSVSRTGIEDLVQYIRGQAEHHRRETFQDEVRRFLKEYGMDYDERTLPNADALGY